MQSTIWTDHKLRHKSRHARFSSWTGTIHGMMLIRGRMEKSLRYISSGFLGFSLSQTHKHVGCCKGKPCPCTDPVWVSLQSGDTLDMVLQREGQTTGFISVPSGVFIPRPYTTLSCSLPPHSVCCGYQRERRRKKVLSSHVFFTVRGFVFCQC